MVLTVSLLILLYLAFLAVMAYYQLDIGLTVVALAAFVFIQYYFSDRLVLWSLGAKLVDEQANPDIYRTIRRLCGAANMPMPRVALIKTEMPNAFATGRNIDHAVVAATTGLIDLLSPEELEAVLAHELTHIRNRDVMIMTLVTFLIDAAYLILRIEYFSQERDSSGDDESPVGGIIAALMLVAFIAYNIGMLLILALSRYREFAADRGAALITGKPSNLISALRKISYGMAGVPNADLKRNRGANALFILPAFNKRSLLNIFSTHPALDKRIEALQRLEGICR